MVLEKHIQVASPDFSILEILKSETLLSSAKIKNAIKCGCLWLEKAQKIKRLRRLDTKLQKDQCLHFYYNEEILTQQPLNAELIEDNKGYSIWYKPAGMLCQGSKWGDHTTINRYVELNLKPQRNAIIVHRLDKMTSGLLILAHHRKIAACFSQLFEQRKISKSYRALVHGIFDSKSNCKTITRPLNEKSAISHLNFIDKNKDLDYSLVDITIETGRKHQIRQHLAMEDFPIVGDRLYGIEKPEDHDIDDLQLCAYRLSFNCPITNELKNYQLDSSKLPQIK